MANEDFTTYSEVDAFNRIIITSAARIDVSSFDNDIVAYAYDDKGVNFFNGNFAHDLEIQLTATSNNSNQYFTWALANLLNDHKGMQDVSGDELAINIVDPSGATAPFIRLNELDGGTAYNASSSIDPTTVRYLTIVRNEIIGPFGTIYLYVYSDSGRTNLLDTVSIELHTSKKDFRYVYAVQSRDTNQVARVSDGYIKDLNLDGIDPNPTNGRGIFWFFQEQN